MILLFLICALNCLVAFAHELSPPIKRYLLRPSAEENSIKVQIAVLRKDLLKISIQDQYIDYVKTERKIFALENRLADIKMKDSSKTLIINFGAGYMLQFGVTLILICTSLFYRYTPVIVLEKKFNFSPFGSLIAFPTGIENAISVPFWIFVSNFTFRSIANFFRS